MKTIITACLILSAIIGIIAKPHYEETRIHTDFQLEPRKHIVDKSTSRQIDKSTNRQVDKSTNLQKMAMVLPSQEEVAQKVKGVFTEEPEVAVAVFRAESGLRPDAQGWNCYYTNNAGIRYSAACAPEDRGRAWSTDCGVAQINTPGNTCPEYLLNVEENLRAAKNKYNARGWTPWVAWKIGRHLAFLK